MYLSHKKKLFVLCLSIIIFLNSCGKKGPPTLKAYEKPETPSGLKAIHKENNIILSWSYTQKENIKGFDILRSEDTAFQKIGNVAGEENSYTDTDFKIGVVYRYKVIARSLKNVLSDDSNVITIKPMSVPPAPTNVLFHVGDNSLSISWDSSGDGVFYNIYRTFEKGKYGFNPINNELVKTNSYTDGLELNKPVYYTVRGVLDNETRDEGPSSVEIEVNPADFIPSRTKGLQTVSTGDKVVIMWAENPEMWITKYRIYRMTVETEGFKLIGESVTPAFADREKTGTKHIYRVTAVGPSKESEFSETIKVDF
ncbi:MAG: hypothetical protein HY754_14305 [Nitrospirae bacterium]|nr:hypothetical protein [Nitrospirota bacterium]